jgi:glycosyltransferase involved in cell wall biosynthesis
MSELIELRLFKIEKQWVQQFLFHFRKLSEAGNGWKALGMIGIQASDRREIQPSTTYRSLVRVGCSMSSFLWSIPEMAWQWPPCDDGVTIPIRLLELNMREEHALAERCFEPSLVTIAVTTHNRSALLQRALHGAFAQTYPKLEILVSDDASTDDTQGLMGKVSDPRFRYVRLDEPAGIAGNFQNALNHATGELFMILNDDDELEPEAIEKLANVFWEPPPGVEPKEVILSWCPCKIQDGQRRVKYVTDAGPSVEAGIDLVTGLFDGTRGPRFCGILMRTREVSEVGFSRDHLGIPDVGIWSRMAVRGGVVCCINEPLARYTAHEASCTGTSTAKSWQKAGQAILRDLIGDLEAIGDKEKQHRIQRSGRNFITGLLATVLMQSMGRPGWKRRAIIEFFRVPQYFITRMTVRRLLLEGGKLLRKAG